MVQYMSDGELLDGLARIKQGNPVDVAGPDDEDKDETASDLITSDFSRPQSAN